MADHVVVEVPLVNPNEPEAMVVDVSVEEGGQIAEGEVLCALETSKSIEDVHAETSGYVFALADKVGTMVVAGEVLCYIATSPDWTPPDDAVANDGDSVPGDLKITEPALALAREMGVDLDGLPRGVLITEKAVREASGAGTTQDLPPGDGKSVIVYGRGGHGKTLIELLRSIGELEPVGVVDDAAAKGSEILGVPVLGQRDDLADIRRDGVALAVNAIGGITNMATRVQVSELLTRLGFEMPALIHPSAVVEGSATIGPGAQVLAQSYVGSDAEIADGVIVNTSAIVSHDCVLGSHVNLAPGCALAGNVTVGERTLLGMGVTSYLGITIGSDVRVGNSATIKADVPDGRRIIAGSSWDGESA